MTDGAIRALAAGDPLTDDEIIARYAVDDRASPWLRTNFVSSIDGAVTHDGRSGGLSPQSDRRVFRLLRRLADVVLVGAGTVRTEEYAAMRLGPASVMWRLHQGMPQHPAFAIVTARLDLDPESMIFTNAPSRPIVVTHGCHDDPGRQERRRRLEAVADVVDCGEGDLDAALLRAELVERGLPQIHCEGGPHLFGTLLAQDAVDELCLTIAPTLEAGDAGRIARGAADTVRMSLAHGLAADDGTLLLRYVRRED